MSNTCTCCGTPSQRKHISFHPGPYEKTEKKRVKWKLNFPTGSIMHHIHLFLSVSECEQEPFRSKGFIFQPSGYFPSTASPLILQKWENNSILHQLSPLRQSDWTLGVAGSVFRVRQLHPAGCVVGVPSVVWELCLQDATLPGEKGLGDFTHYSSAI